MPLIRTSASMAAAALMLTGCSKSDLDRCIDSQMAVWEQKQEDYEEQVQNHTPAYAEGETVIIAGVEVSRNALSYPSSPGTSEEAEARANLRCGKVYAGNN